MSWWSGRCGPARLWRVTRNVLEHRLPPGKPGSKIHVFSDRGGLPLTVAVSAANAHDSLAVKPLVMAIPAVKSRRGSDRDGGMGAATKAGR